MNKSIKKMSLMLGIAGSIVLSNSIFGAVGDEGIVKGSYINLRAEPKFQSQIVGKKLRGDYYTVVFEKENWLKVLFSDNTEGWIYRTLIESPNETIRVKPIDEVLENEQNPPSEDKENKADKADKSVNTETLKDNKTESKDNKDEIKPLIKPIKDENIPDVIEFSGSAEDLYNEAIKLYELRKYSEALEKNKAASKKAPKNAEILNNLGNCEFKLGRIEEALESWKQALKIAPRSGKICNNLGIAYYQLDKNDDAVEYYKKAIMFEPDFGDPYYNLASVYGFTGNFEEALKYYRKFLEFNPDDTMKKLTDERISYCERQLNKK